MKRLASIAHLSTFSWVLQLGTWTFLRVTDAYTYRTKALTPSSKHRVSHALNDLSQSTVILCINYTSTMGYYFMQCSYFACLHGSRCVNDRMNTQCRKWLHLCADNNSMTRWQDAWVLADAPVHAGKITAIVMSDERQWRKRLTSGMSASLSVSAAAARSRSLDNRLSADSALNVILRMSAIYSNLRRQIKNKNKCSTSRYCYR